MGTWKPDRVFYPHFRGKNGPAPNLPADKIAAYGRALADALYGAALAGDAHNVLGSLGDIVAGYDKTGVYTPDFENKIRSIAGISEPTTLSDIYAIWANAIQKFVAVIQAFEVGLSDYDNDSTPDDDGSSAARIMHALPVPDQSTAN